MNAPVGTTSKGRSTLGLTAAVVAITFWSAGNVMVRKVPMPALQIAFWRILLAAVVYTAAVYISGRRLTTRQLLRSAPTGIVISLEIAVFFAALKATTVANATVIGALLPLITLGVASRRFGETVTRWLVGSSVVALGGVALVMWGSSGKAIWSPRGDALAFVAVVLFAAYFILAKSAREDVPAFEFQTALWIVGSVVLAPVAMIDAGGLVWPSWGDWAWLFGLLAVPGTGHLAMNWAHPRVRLVTTSMLVLAVPVITSTGGVLFLDESVNAVQVVGMVIVLGVLSLVVRREAQLLPA